MNTKAKIVSYTMAAMAGISFLCGLVVLSSEDGLSHE